jgi:acyl carrier protein
MGTVALPEHKKHQTNAVMDWAVLDVLHYRPCDCPRKLDSCVSFHKGTTKKHKKYGEEASRCSFLRDVSEDQDHIWILCTTHTIASRVKQIIVDKLCVSEDRVTPDTKFVDLNTDSLDKVTLVMEFEDTFDVIISDESATKIVTVGDVVSYLEKHTPVGHR